jgi:hypothetical protein
MDIERDISAVRRRGIGSRAITFLLLFAFALQSYLTQTHIHGISGTPAQTCISKCVVHSPISQSPLGGAAECPLCQAIVHAGAFYAPAALAVLVLCVWVENALATPAQSAPRAALARNGLSRAPPR